MNDSEFKAQLEQQFPDLRGQDAEIRSPGLQTAFLSLPPYP